MSTYYSGKLMNQLIHIRNSETGKLRFFSKILTTFELQKYLTFSINQYVRSLLTKLIESVTVCLPQKLILVNHIHNPWTVQSLSDGYNI
jgi:hypothetical protein